MKQGQRKRAKLRKMWPLKVFSVTVTGWDCGIKAGDRITMSGVRKVVK